ncbi:zinc metalloprotease HtpX [candidate division WWE3 bacterium RIFCSPHIGHO2_01_FULL_48_15]|uniref:Protease HtpX homolog n=1 Tax=candidate division WWE3 bacterium RIFCSPHIGHO2_01_FULL_48_15 TaxID=1802619 RepID=A0A1F4VGC7_UNCKA|nr:MAG: zinc metalloprotease HtpX [candidate division WWE3 bacterium RIFCSPHIGHO2_01_FULL_48_15]
MTLYSQITDNKRKTFFLFFFTFLVIIVLGYIFGLYFGDTYTFAIGAFVFSLLYSGTAYFFSDKVVLAISGAKQIEKKDNPQLYRAVENLCIGAGLPMPKIYIMEDKALNAFATGRDPKHAVVVVTRGLLNNLEDEELEGVLAHELSHIQNYDIRIATFAAVLAGAVVMIADIFLRSVFWGGGNRGRRDGAGVLIFIGVAFAILSPFIAQVIRLSISRQREYLADSSGALLTRYPEGLASALEKLSIDKSPVRNVSNATAHLYIKNPLGGNPISGLFSTHPPIEDRIRRLREI